MAKRAVIPSLRRCGWDHSDAHILRHTIASRLLREGTPMKHIAAILAIAASTGQGFTPRSSSNRLSAVALPSVGGIMMAIKTMAKHVEANLAERS